MRSESDEHHRALVTLSATALSAGLMSIGLVVAAVIFGLQGQGWPHALVGAGAGLLGLVLTRSGRPAEAVLTVSVVVASVLVAADVMIDSPIDRGAGFLLLPTLIVAVGFTSGERYSYGYTLFCLLAVAVSAWDESLLDSGTGPDRVNAAIIRVVLDCLLLVFAGVLTSAIARTRQTRQEALETALRDIDDVVVLAEQVAAGDLRKPITGDDDLSRAVRQMQGTLRRVVGEVQQGATVLTPASTQIASAARENDRLAQEQAGAIQVTRTALESLSQEAAQIAQTSADVVGNASIVQETNREMEVLFADLQAIYKRIDTLLLTIRAVSRKSELLALNAALEGTHAGEGGRGFSLIAHQMKALSEQTHAAGSDVTDLVTDIREATERASESFSTMREVAALNIGLAVRIRQASEQQRADASGLVGALGDIDRGGQELASSSRQTIDMAAHLAELSRRLESAVTSFEVSK